MAKVFAIYQQPKDPAAFDVYYFEPRQWLLRKVRRPLPISPISPPPG